MASNGVTGRAAKRRPVGDLEARVVLNVGGTRFETFCHTLQRYPNSPLAALQPGAHGEIFLDRNPKAFEVVLDFLRSGKVYGGQMADSRVQEEMAHWGLTSYASETLPNHILLMVFKYFPLALRVRVLAQVCRQWRRVVMQDRPDVHVKCMVLGILPESAPGTDEETEDPSSGLELTIAQPVARRVAIEVDMQGPDSQLPLFCSAPRLARMLANHLDRQAPHCQGNLVLHLTNKAPLRYVTSLTIRNSNLSRTDFAPLAGLGHLQFLALANCPGATPQLLASLQRLPHLHGLDLEGCPHLTGSKDVLPTFEYLPQATSLKTFLWRDSRQDVAVVRPLLTAVSQLGQLRRLYLDLNLSLASDDDSLGLLRGLTSLQDLELDTEEFDSALDFLAVVRDMPQLRRLQCDFFCDRDPDIEEVLLDTLAQLTNLERFGTAHNVTKHFWAKFPPLQNLKVLATYLYQPERSELVALVGRISSHLPGLESLRIVLEDCHLVEDSAQKVTGAVLLSVFSPLAFLQQIDLTGYHICSDLQLCGREAIKARLQKALPATVISNSGSCTDCLFPDDDDL